jgi:hypothetical protein
MTRPLVRFLAVVALLATLVAGAPGVRLAIAAAPTPIQVYGAWHCSDDYCTWGAIRTVAAFDSMNHWLIDRGDGSKLPSVNLVVLSFVNPLKLLKGTTDGTTANGVPRGMTPEIVNYFTSKGIRVMVSIGGITYTKDWNTALAENGTLLGTRAAAMATALGVGVEIDYEEANSPNLTGLEAFIRAYRLVHGFDPTDVGHPEKRLTIDLAAGDRWLIGIAQKSTADWLRTVDQVPAVALDYANAMVPSKQPTTSAAIANWQEHVDGKPRYSPPIPPLAPVKFTGSVYVAEGSRVRPECTNFAVSLQSSTGSFVQTVAPKVGTTPGMLGYMFWAAEKPSTRGVGTQPPNTCEGGVGVGATTYDIPIPMLVLPQQ